MRLRQINPLKSWEMANGVRKTLVGEGNAGQMLGLGLCLRA